MIAFAGRFSVVSFTYVVRITMPIRVRTMRALQILSRRKFVMSRRGGAAAGTNHTHQRWVAAKGRSRAPIVLLANLDQPNEPKNDWCVGER